LWRWYPLTGERPWRYSRAVLRPCAATRHRRRRPARRNSRLLLANVALHERHAIPATADRIRTRRARTVATHVRRAARRRRAGREDGRVEVDRSSAAPVDDQRQRARGGARVDDGVESADRRAWEGGFLSKARGDAAHELDEGLAGARAGQTNHRAGDSGHVRERHLLRRTRGAGTAKRPSAARGRIGFLGESLFGV